eukprot:1124743-Pelagomonas_calceolata.AAC.4
MPTGYLAYVRGVLRAHLQLTLAVKTLTTSIKEKGIPRVSQPEMPWLTYMYGLCPLNWNDLVTATVMVLGCYIVAAADKDEQRLRKGLHGDVM